MKFNDAIAKCVAKYAASWPKLQKKAKGTGATCDAPRLIDNGDGPVFTGFLASLDGSCLAAQTDVSIPTQAWGLGAGSVTVRGKLRQERVRAVRGGL